MMNSSRSSMGALPPHFVDAMRVLFDIMDTERTGYIRFDDLARKWKHLPPAAPNVPPGFLNCLHKVTPPNGMLTFERFCAGLRLALAENRSRETTDRPAAAAAVNGHASLQRVASEGRLAAADHSQRDSHHAPALSSSNGQQSSLDKKKVPMGLAAKLENRRSMQAFGSTPAVNRAPASSNDHWFEPPPMARNGAHAQSLRSMDNYENIDVIMREKKNKLPSRWTNGQAKQAVAQSPTNAVPPTYSLYQQQQQKGRHPVPPPPPPVPTLERLAEGNHPPRVDAHQTQQQQQQQQQQHQQQQPRGFRPISAVSTGSGGSSNSSGAAPPNHSIAEGSVRWRDRSKMTNVSDGRRHTMSEENAPKVAKHERLLDEEKELVRRGLDTCSKLVNWYNERLTSLEKRSEFLGRGMVALDSAVHEERLNYLRAHVTEVNRRMVSLMESSERGFPTHINLEVRNHLPQPSDDQLIWLHRQNRQLTEEISEKTKLIEQNEREKKALMKQLHELRNGQMSSASSVISQNFHRPSALVRPALHQPNTPTYIANGQNHISAHKPLPVKVHATLM